MKDFFKQYGVVMVSTIELIVTILAFVWVGKYLDRSFDLSQKGLIGATVIGSILAFVRYTIKLQKMNKDENQ